MKQNANRQKQHLSRGGEDQGHVGVKETVDILQPPQPREGAKNSPMLAVHGWNMTRGTVHLVAISADGVDGANVLDRQMEAGYIAVR